MNFFKDAAQVSNSNLVRNANTLLLCGGAKINADGVINLIGKSQRLDQDRFKCTYLFLFGETKEAAGQFKILNFRFSNNVLVFGVSSSTLLSENFAGIEFRESGLSRNFLDFAGI